MLGAPLQHVFESLRLHHFSVQGRSARWPVLSSTGRLGALLDKLVAVQMDLEPVCGVGKERAQIVATLDSIASACDVLRSAIADVRNIINQVDGLVEMAEAEPAQASGKAGTH